MTHPGIERLGKRVLDCVTDVEVQAAAIVELARAYPTAASTAVMDLTVEAEAFGAKVTFSDDEIPTVTGRRVVDQATVEALEVPKVSSGRLPLYQEAIRRAAAQNHQSAGPGGLYRSVLPGGAALRDDRDHGPA